MAHAQAADGFLETLQAEIPVAAQVFETTDRTGLVIVDEVNGFASVGAGPLAPPVENPQVTGCVAETVRVARAFADLGRPIAAFLDTHVPGKPEPPYPPHCEVGTGQEDLVAELQWLSDHPGALLIRKDCINGFVGAIESKQALAANTHGLEWLSVFGRRGGSAITASALNALASDSL